MRRSRMVVVLAVAAAAMLLAGGAVAEDQAATWMPPSHDQKTDEFLKGTSHDFWDNIDLLTSGKNREHVEDENRFKAFSLYPQAFSAVKPEIRQETPAKSYLLSYDRNKDNNAYLGMANIDTADKLELKKLYQNNYNAELLVGYQWGNYGSILFGRGLQFERDVENNNMGRLNDMGWRIKFMKTF